MSLQERNLKHVLTKEQQPSKIDIPY